VFEHGSSKQAALSHGFWLSRLFYCSGSFEPASRWRGEPYKAYVELQADETSAT
jgi:hypothetical protein